MGQRAVRNRGYTYRETLPPKAAGRTLLDYLAAEYPHSSPAEWRARIAAGRVELDGRKATPETPLAPGRRLAWHRPPWIEPEAPASFAVLYRDEALLAVAKPRGLPTLPGAGFLESTLLHRVRRLDPAARPVHRLGRGTSGVALCSRTPAAHRALTEAWQARRVRRVYRALVRGRVDADAFAVDVPIGPVPHPVLGLVHAASAEGKPSRSLVRVLERREDETLVAVELVTGRPHQVRIHLAACGHPLVGDRLYGPGGRPRPATRALPGEPGYWLHAERIELAHPTSGDPVVVACAPPPRLREGGGR